MLDVAVRHSHHIAMTMGNAAGHAVSMPPISRRPAMHAAQPFVDARDFLQTHRDDCATAYREFRWPRLDRFNWALDYFDGVLAQGDGDALWIIDDDGAEVRRTFRELSERSNRIANALRSLGARRG